MTKAQLTAPAVASTGTRAAKVSAVALVLLALTDLGCVNSFSVGAGLAGARAHGSHRPQHPRPAVARAPLSPVAAPPLSAAEGDGDGDGGANDEEEEIDLSLDPRLYRLRLPRAPGIEWGTDLSFSFVYVRSLEPAGPASLSGEVNAGDQLCELRAVGGEAGAKTKNPPVNLLGAPFDGVMGAFADLGRKVREVDLVFFRGTKDELKAVCEGTGAEAVDDMVTITVVQNKGSPEENVREIRAKKGCNVRQVLVDEGVNVYQSFTRWTNCEGKQLCGTCIVNVPLGGENTNRKSMDEGSTLRENPETYRLSCVMFAYGDCVVETFPPINAAQWTR